MSERQKGTPARIVINRRAHCVRPFQQPLCSMLILTGLDLQQLQYYLHYQQWHENGDSVACIAVAYTDWE